MTNDPCINGEETTERIRVAGMSCLHCAEAVKGAIEGVPGVKSAMVDLPTGYADVDFINSEGIVQKFKDAVTGAGFTIIE